MGYTQASGMAEAVQRGDLELETALRWHIRHNFWPPVPLSMLPVVVAAVAACRDDAGERLIDLPEGITYRDGRARVEAWRISAAFHLEAFIEGSVL